MSKLYGHYCVVNSENYYVDFVRVELDDDGHARSCKLADGERLVSILHPDTRPHAGVLGLLRPRLNQDTITWFEAAAQEEITAWEAAHPAPVIPSIPSTEDRLIALEAVQLEQILGGAV